MKSTSLVETHGIAENFLNTLSFGSEAVVVALQGDLGSGKTSFTQEAGKVLGINETLVSPTFVIEKIYAIDWKGFKRFIHIDAYRLEKESELSHLGWEEIIKEPENLIFIEWPERVPGLIPNTAKRIDFQFIDETTREINYA